MTDMPWKTYEEVAAYLLNEFAKEFGLSRVETKQSIIGQRSGTPWAIDAKGIRHNNEGFVIIECRRYTTTKQNQEKLGGLAYRIIDSGADGGIIVSPLGLQAGANKIAQSENIISIELHEDSTPLEFSMQFLNKIFIGVVTRATISSSCDAEHIRYCDKCSKQFFVSKNEHTCPSCSSTI
ncbi:MAG: hypothetical protein PHP85_10575 [Gallionella sp.]|nr:hypothetical protein [Gallionella sp.]